MPKINELNEFAEGMVCPTHGGYEMWQKVWKMNNNRPVEVRIVGINISGFHRCGWCGFGNKKEIDIIYKVTDTLHFFDESSGVTVANKELFPTKQELLDSMS